MSIVTNVMLRTSLHGETGLNLNALNYVGKRSSSYHVRCAVLLLHHAEHNVMCVQAA